MPSPRPVPVAPHLAATASSRPASAHDCLGSRDGDTPTLSVIDPAAVGITAGLAVSVALGSADGVDEAEAGAVSDPQHLAGIAGPLRCVRDRQPRAVKPRLARVTQQHPPRAKDAQAGRGRAIPPIVDDQQRVSGAISVPGLFIARYPPITVRPREHVSRPHPRRDVKPPPLDPRDRQEPAERQRDQPVHRHPDQAR